MFMFFLREPCGLKIKLVGGLGNQLFGYFAGLDVANSNGMKLFLDVTDIRGKRNKHNVTIESFKLNGVLYERGLFRETKRRASYFIYKIFGTKLFLDKNYYSGEVGYDPNVFLQECNVCLHGYFQTYKHFMNYQKNFHGLELRNPSLWYLNRVDKFKKEKIIAIHVRRGDYVEHADKYGLLSKKYYANAYLELIQTQSYSKVWVFSDDTETARANLGDFLPVDTKWVESSEVEDDAEVMKLMSHANAIIIANSTFSWWAAMLSQPGTKVIAPTTWYKGMDDPKDLIPNNWLRIESVWE